LSERSAFDKNCPGPFDTDYINVFFSAKTDFNCLSYLLTHEFNTRKKPMRFKFASDFILTSTP